VLGRFTSALPTTTTSRFCNGKTKRWCVHAGRVTWRGLPLCGCHSMRASSLLPQHDLKPDKSPARFLPVIHLRSELANWLHPPDVSRTNTALGKQSAARRVNGLWEGEQCLIGWERSDRFLDTWHYRLRSMLWCVVFDENEPVRGNRRD